MLVDLPPACVDDSAHQLAPSVCIQAVANEIAAGIFNETFIQISSGISALIFLQFIIQCDMAHKGYLRREQNIVFGANKLSAPQELGRTFHDGLSDDSYVLIKLPRLRRLKYISVVGFKHSEQTRALRT